MTRKGDPESLLHATRGFGKGPITGTNTNGLRRARQIAQGRSFVYDGSLAPVCIACGQPRQNRRALKCDFCESLA